MTMGDQRTIARDSQHERAGRLALDLPPVRRAATTGLVVGSVDDAAERDADAVADMVLRNLDGAAAAPRAAAAPNSRVRRAPSPDSSPIGAEGGALDGATAARIQRARGRGAALADPVRGRMEQGFAAAGRPADLSNVRVHQGAEASQLNEAISARAFTVGNDVFVHDSTDLASRDGQRVLTHELAHTTQQPGGVHRLWNVDTFKAQTSEGVLTGKSTAQKEIEKLLAGYNALITSSVGKMTPQTIDELNQMLADMQAIAQSWITSHTVKKSGGDLEDPNRKVRMAGMKAFLTECSSEKRALDVWRADIAKDMQGQGKDPGQAKVTAPSPGVKQVEDHYAPDNCTSAFRRLGSLIDAAAPLDGDQATIALSVKIPVQPPAFVGFEFGAQVGRDGGKVSVAVNLGITGGASVGGVADLAGALGGYLKATAKTGADAAELMSYALFRRCRQSNLVPREIENKLWGGDTGEYGWQKAEDWSRGGERRIFTDDDAEVESGMYGSVSAKGKVGNVAELGGSVKGTLGTKINKQTITGRKGGVGAQNLRSGADQNAQDKDYATSDRRGAQKSVGAGTGGLQLSFGAKTAGLDGSINGEVGWTSTTDHGPKELQFKTFKLELQGGITLPANKMIGTLCGTILPTVAQSFVKAIRATVGLAEEKGSARGGGVLAGEVASWTNSVAGIATISKDKFEPLKLAEDAKAGTEYSGSTKYSLTLEADFKPGESDVELSLALNQVDTGGVSKVVGEVGKTVDVVNFSLERSSRLIKLTYNTGSGWAVT
jgi:hypothetical protein